MTGATLRRGVFQLKVTRLFDTFNIRRCLLILYISLFFGDFTTPVTAQIPDFGYSMAYATVKDKTLYIHGGYIETAPSPSNQFFALDLTQPSWNTSRPPWKTINVHNLADQRHPGVAAHTMTVSKDQQMLIAFYGHMVFKYHFANETWSAPMKPSLNFTILSQQAVTDPNSGLVYVPGPVGSDYISFAAGDMLVYNPETGVCQAIPMPTEHSSGRFEHFAAAWSEKRNSLLIHGGWLGSTTKTAIDILIEYNPATSAWKQVPRLFLELAYGGSKMIVFGGWQEIDDLQSTIYILDIDTMTWSQGQSAPPEQARASMVCTSIGDNFLAWGGIVKSRSKGGAPIIYNIKDNQWTTQYSYSTSSPDTSTSTAISTSKVNDAVINRVVGAVVIVIVAVFFV
ncbi:hypothetical protein BX616_001242 [Lobosporangium transversale]|nr:hypothetical protein BX616_001242 [Lobosporangium transversale]